MAGTLLALLQRRYLPLGYRYPSRRPAAPRQADPQDTEGYVSVCTKSRVELRRRSKQEDTARSELAN